MRFQNKVALIFPHLVFFFTMATVTSSKFFTDIQTKKGLRKKAPVKIFRERIFCRLLIILLSRDTSGARFFCESPSFCFIILLGEKERASHT